MTAQCKIFQTISREKYGNILQNIFIKMTKRLKKYRQSRIKSRDKNQISLPPI